jgi:hypothetical protein
MNFVESFVYSKDPVFFSSMGYLAATIVFGLTMYGV